MSFILRSVVSAFLTTFLATSAFAAQTSFDCEGEEEDGIQVRMTFTILNLNQPNKIEAVPNGSDPEGEQSPIVFGYKKAGGVRWQYPAHPYNFVRAAALNGGDSSDFYIGKDNAGRTFLGRNASDSCVSASLILYANTGYRRGYLQSVNHCDPAGKDKSYSKVACTVE